ncbi:FlgD immunoglobulin-like domain containing protein [Streptomyces sp. NPDC048659]|uniref:FlgD immunoglobulin-like domain containing protein n=1 Tax=Streptomyces sp. NPDC048659 TaxID=3155489 RepID=UPI00344A93F0
MRSVTRSRRGRAAAAVVATAAAIVSLVPLGADPAVAAGPQAAPPAEAAEFVLPAELAADPDSVTLAGATGFVQGGEGRGYHWYSYADGSRTPIPGRSPKDTGTDLVASFGRSDVRFWDPATGTTRTIPVPAGQTAWTTVGRSVLTFEDKKPWLGHLLTLEQDQVTERPLTLPEGAEVVADMNGRGNPYGLWLSYRLNGAVTTLWVDRSLTARAVDLGPAPTGGANVRADRYLFRFPVPGRVQIWDLTGNLSAPLHTLDWAGGTPAALLGDRILTRVPGDGGDRLVARPLAGGPEQEVLDRLTGATQAGPDGRLVAVRAGDGHERTVHSIQAGADGGAPVVARVAEVPPVTVEPRDLEMAQGVLLSKDAMPDGSYRLREREVTTGGAPTVGPARELTGPGGCAALPGCDAIPTGDGRALFAGAGGRMSVLEPGGTLPGKPLASLPTELSATLRASGRHVSYDAGTYDVDVTDIDSQEVVSRHFAPGNGKTHALVGDMLFRGTVTGGDVEAFDVRTGEWRGKRKVADCASTALQAWGAYAYWRCGDGTAGVRQWGVGYDIPVPAHTRAMLGDGYLAHSKDGVLSVTPLNGTGETRVIGGGDGTGAVGSWTVDRFGGALAYVDGRHRVHVVRPGGVPASPLSFLDVDKPAVLDLTDGETSWTGRWWLNKPAGSWKLTIRDRAKNAVRTLSGGEARGLVKAVWDGRGEDGGRLAEGLYTWEMAVTPADGVGWTQTDQGGTFLTRSGLGTFRPLTPSRTLSTVTGTGAPKAKVGPGGTVTLKVAGRGGVPVTGVTAVTMNVTATNATASTYVTVYPGGTPKPATSSLNVAAGRTAPNLVTVPVGKDGTVTLYNHAGSVDLLADVAGYHTLDETGDRFEAVSPARLLSTVTGIGAPKSPVTAGGTVTVQVAGRGGVPATGVTAVTVNVTATNPTTATYVSAYPYDTARPATSNLNVTAGETVANLVTVPVKDGRITLYNHAGSVDLLADVAGYFTDTPGQGDRFRPVPPGRLLSTVTGVSAPKAKLGPGGTVTLPVTDRAGVPATGVSAIVLNVTATNPTTPTYVSAYPHGTPRPPTSNLNVTTGRTVANQVVVPVRDGKVTLYNHAGTVDLLADVAGYYAQ